MFDFEQQLKVGKKGEDSLLIRFPFLEKTDGRKADFIIKEGYPCAGDFLELKTETRTIEETKNFFIESYSDTERRTVGGPWRARNDGVRFYAHLFKCGALYIFDTAILLPHLVKAIKIKKIPAKKIKNKTWVTTGYAVSRELLIETPACVYSKS